MNAQLTPNADHFALTKKFGAVQKALDGMMNKLAIAMHTPPPIASEPLNPTSAKNK